MRSMCISLKGYPLGEGQEFLKAVVKEASNLQVLILHHWGDDDKWEVKFLDDFCTYLSSCQTFCLTFECS